MVVNNWMLLVDLYEAVMGDNPWIRLYFFLFYYVSVIIGINLVVAYTIDMYSSVERIDKDRRVTMHFLKKKLQESE